MRIVRIKPIKLRIPGNLIGRQKFIISQRETLDGRSALREI